MPAPNTMECRHTNEHGTESLAIYSEDKQCRYLLERIWNPDLPVLMFVMFHPSTATVISNNDDGAVQICEDRAKNYHLPNNQRLGFDGHEFGGVYVTNIFPFIQTEQNPPVNEDDLNCIENRRIIKKYARIPNTTVVCAWGEEFDYDVFSNHADRIKRMLFSTGVPLNYFGLTQDRQQPKHVYRHENIENFKRWRI